MIVRIWHGWTEPANADAYQELLETNVVPGIFAREIPGLVSLDTLRRRADNGEMEFVTIMKFDDWSAVEVFAGPGTTSVVPAAAQELLSRYDQHSQHYELISHHTGTS